MLDLHFQADLASAIPVYQQIGNRLRAAIEKGEWPYGSRIPTLRDLASQYRTSIFTIQTAMDALAKAGMIESRRGRGTFVTASSARLSSVGISFGRNFLQGREAAYYQELYRILAANLDERRIKREFWLPLVGGVFVVEALSVMIQVASFKLTGKRVFRMAPIHHHFEKGGMAEQRVVLRFYIVGALLALLSLATFKLQ